jgi:hypothetical protein
MLNKKVIVSKYPRKATKVMNFEGNSQIRANYFRKYNLRTDTRIAI